MVQGRVAWAHPMALLCLAGLSACENRHTIGPEAWWHDAVGGKIAADRPAPPGDKDPFPLISAVPAKPPAPDAAAINRMTAGLIADRIAASHAAAIAPIPPPVPKTAVAPVKPGAPAPVAASTGNVPLGNVPLGTIPPGEPGASASLVASGSPPPLPAQTARPAVPSPAPPAKAASVGAAGPAASGPLPPLPNAEPARPRIAPGPPKPAPGLSAAPPPEAPRPVDGTQIEFAARSAVLGDAAIARVKELAASRGQRGIAVTGYGDALASDPLTQSAALDLALRRAQTVATALTAEGVPNAFLRVNAEAAGRGASLRLLQ